MVGGAECAAFHPYWFHGSAPEGVVDAEVEAVGVIGYHGAEPY